jgi:TusA-related sulfurtransferase
VDHPYAAKTSFDSGELDCGSGLLLLIRKHIDPRLPGELLEIRSREISVGEELPAWCRMTGNELVSHLRRGGEPPAVFGRIRRVRPLASMNCASFNRSHQVVR